MSLQSYSFVIPAFNESRRLSATLDAIALFSSCYTSSCEIIVIDDGSTDGTAELAQAFFAPHCRVSVHSFPHRGKGFAIRQGMMAAQGDIVVLCDADLRESMVQVLSLIESLEEGVDVAIGSRWHAATANDCSQPLFRRISSRAFNIVAGYFLALPFRDTQCCLKTLTRAAASEICPLLSLDGWGYDLELIHVAMTRGLRIKEVGLQLTHDYGDSHFRPIRDGWVACLEMLKIRWNDARGAYGPCALSRTISKGAFALGGKAISSQKKQAIQGVDPKTLQRNQDSSHQCDDLHIDAHGVKLCCIPSQDDVAA